MTGDNMGSAPRPNPRVRVRVGAVAFFVFLGGFAAASVLVLGLGLLAVVAASNPGLHDRLHTIGFGTNTVARVAEGIADASHKAEPIGQLLLDYVFSGFNLVLAGLLIWLRPRDRTARLLAVGMVGTAGVFNLQAESVYHALQKTAFESGLYSLHRLLAGGAYGAALLLFPDGRIVPRWPRWAQALLYGPLLLVAILLSVRIQPQEQATASVSRILFFGLVTPIIAVLAQAYRNRRSQTPEERQQSRLLFWALLPALVVGLFVLTQGIRGLLAPGLEGRPFQGLPVVVFRIFQPVFALIPIALAVGILRYRLWNIDKVISKTLVYGSLVGFISAVYVGVVVGIGRVVGSTGNNLILSLAATGIVAVAFQPAKDRLQRLANRLVYGARATPYEVLSEFSKRMGETYATRDLLARMATILAEGTGAARAEVWLRVGTQLRPAGVWPEGTPLPEPRRLEGEQPPEFASVDRSLVVTHQGELLGALTIAKPAGQPLTLPESKLLEDLASQAGLVLRNVRLTAELLDRLDELRASRQRLVTAQDQERRRIERNIHDGAQQQLVALKVKLSLAEKMAEKVAPSFQQVLSQLRIDADDAIETLRDLARGIYPPLLAAEGIGRALEAHLRRVTVPVSLQVGDLGRFPQEVEAAVYFCCLEALQNVAKYAEATRVVLRVWKERAYVSFEIQDDGHGFDTCDYKPGAGLQNMTDRVETLGGRLEVSSAVGIGTRVSGSIPLDGRAPAAPPILPLVAEGTHSPAGARGDGSGQPPEAAQSDELAAASAAERRGQLRADGRLGARGRLP
ncbi:MAG: sensor histidine kinase [Actinomycetota bacterium]